MLFSSGTIHHRDVTVVSYGRVHGLVVHVKFWSSPDLMGPHKGAGPKILIFLVCVPEAHLWSCGMCVHVQFWFSQDVRGHRRGQNEKKKENPNLVAYSPLKLYVPHTYNGLILLRMWSSCACAMFGLV